MIFCFSQVRNLCKIEECTQIVGRDTSKTTTMGAITAPNTIARQGVANAVSSDTATGEKAAATAAKAGEKAAGLVAPGAARPAPSC